MAQWTRGIQGEMAAIKGTEAGMELGAETLEVDGLEIQEMKGDIEEQETVKATAGMIKEKMTEEESVAM